MDLTDPHRLAEARGLAYHRAVAERLRVEPAILERARRRVDGWLSSGEVHPEYAERWRDILGRSVDAICEQLVRDDDDARTLRSVTPFAGAIDPRVRWRIWRQVREARTR